MFPGQMLTYSMRRSITRTRFFRNACLHTDTSIHVVPLVWGREAFHSFRVPLASQKVTSLLSTEDIVSRPRRGRYRRPRWRDVAVWYGTCRVRV